MQVIDRRSLNRATLARQLLLERATASVSEVVTRLVGLQAQDPDPPYVGLWTRIDGFAVGDLERQLHDRSVVRATLFRGTQHLTTAEDYLWVRPLLQQMLGRWQRTAFGKGTGGADPDELAEVSRAAIGAGTVIRRDLGAALAQRWPAGDPVALARSVQGLLPVLHPPPDGLWGHRGPTPFALAEAWLGRPLRAGAAPAELVLRYLAAFGPATVKDVQAWSGLTRLREIVDGLRGQLLTLRGPDGQELHDLPDAPRPGPDVPAPVRYLPLLDNVVVGYADRSRIIAQARRSDAVVSSAVILDGVVGGFWRIVRIGRSVDAAASLEVRLSARPSAAECEALTAEGLRLLRFAAAEATDHDVRLMVQ